MRGKVTASAARSIAIAIALVISVVLGWHARPMTLAGSDVEQRVADFWRRIDAMNANDLLGASELGQWALNMIERDPAARIAVSDFRWSTAAMQAAIDRAPRVGQKAPANGEVEQRIADFWQRVDALRPADHVGAADLGQWALNITDRDPGARMVVSDFRVATTGMQTAIDRAGRVALPAPTATPRARAAPGRALTVERAFAAMGPIGGPYHPPDPVLAVGPATIVVATNHGIEIRSKTGVLIDRTNLPTFFASVRAEGEGQADPRVLFDPWTQRFIVHVHGGIFQPCAVGQCVFHNFLGVSRTQDPRSLSASDWFFYALDASLDGSTPTDHQVDYVRLGVSQTSVVLVSVHPRAGRPGEEGGAAFTKVRLIEKSALLAGKTATWRDVSRFPDPFTGRVDHVQMQPAIHYDQADTFFLVSVTPGIDGCSVTVWGLREPLSSAQLTYRIVRSDRPPGVQCPRSPDPAQPGHPPLQVSNTPAIAAPAVYRAGSLWMTYHFGQTIGGRQLAAVRVVEIDVSRWPDATVKQDIVLSDPVSSSFFPALTVTAAGDVALVYARSGEAEFPSAYVTGRLASDPINVLRPVTLLKAGAAPQIGSTGCNCGAYRWGDYLAAAPDPVDGSAWVIGEYTETAVLWGTWVGRIDWR